MKKLNLKPKPDTNPIAVCWDCGNFEPLYNPLDCDVRIINLPPIIKSAYSTTDLCSDRDLEELNLKPRSNMKPIAVVWNNRISDEDWDYYWDLKQCQQIDESLPPVYPQKPDNLYFEKELEKLNLRLASHTNPTGCIKGTLERSDVAFGNGESSKMICGEYSLLYDPAECQLVNSSLPPCYDKDRLPPQLKSEWAWSKVEPLFEVKEDVVAKGCFLLPKAGNKYETVFLYDRSQLKIHDREVYLSKTKLKKHYKLSDSWLKKLGEPDNVETFKINDLNVEAHLYSRSRIEGFLSQYAEEYANHLEKRNVYLAIFEKNKDKLLSPQARAKAKQTRKDKKKVKPVVREFGWDANNKLVREQSLRCLRCASGTVMGSGYFCAINPEGLTVEQLPCPDWAAR